MSKTYYITKYAVTQGIFTVKGEVSNEFPSMLTVPKSAHGSFTQYYHKPDWHDTAEDAVRQAEAMRIKAVASTEKKISKLKALKFTAETVKFEQ